MSRITVQLRVSASKQESVTKTFVGDTENTDDLVVQNSRALKQLIGILNGAESVVQSSENNDNEYTFPTAFGDKDPVQMVKSDIQRRNDTNYVIDLSLYNIKDELLRVDVVNAGEAFTNKDGDVIYCKGTNLKCREHDKYFRLSHKPSKGQRWLFHYVDNIPEEDGDRRATCVIKSKSFASIYERIYTVQDVTKYTEE